MIMSKKINIDNNIEKWSKAVQTFLDKKCPSCPYCGSEELVVTANCGDDRIGYLTMTCPYCEKTGYISRIKFPEGIDIEHF